MRRVRLTALPTLLLASVCGAQAPAPEGPTGEQGELLVRVAAPGTPERAPPPREPPRLSLALRDGDVRAALDAIARAADEEVVALPDVGGTVSVSVADAPWPDALHAVVEAAGLSVARGTGYRVVSRAPLAIAVPAPPEPALPPGPRLDVRAVEQDPADVGSAIGGAAGKHVLVDPSVEGRVSFDATGVPWGVAVSLLAREARCEVLVARDDLVILRPLPRHVFRASGAPARAWLALLAGYTELRLEVPDDLDLLVSVDLTGVLVVDAIRLTAWTHGLEVAIEGDALRVTRTAAAVSRPALPHPIAAPPAAVPLHLHTTDDHFAAPVLRPLQDAAARGDLPAAERAFAGVEALAARLEGADDEEQVRTGAALRAQAKGLLEHAARLATLELDLGPALRVTAIARPVPAYDEDLPPAVIVGGEVAREGDTLGGPGGPRVVAVEPARVLLRAGEMDVYRGLGGE